MKFPEIASETLELREISEKNRLDIFALFSNKDVVEYYDLEVFTEIEQADKLISLFKNRFVRGEGIRWGIFQKSGNKCIGTCGFNSWSIPMRTASIGYDLQSDYWRKGVMTEALNLILNYAFSGYLACPIINRVQADTVLGNTASENLLIKLGFNEEGIRRQSGYWKGKYHDLKCFALLRADYES